MHDVQSHAIRLSTNAHLRKTSFLIKYIVRMQCLMIAIAMAIENLDEEMI